MLGALAERATVRLLADESDHARPELAREGLEPLGAAGEVSGSEIAGAGRRPVGGVRDTDPERQQVELLGGLEQARREAGGVEQAPEVVAGVGEVRVRGIRMPARVDATEDDREPRREHVRHRRRRRHAVGLCGFGLARLEARLEGEPDPLGQHGRRASVTGSPDRTTLTVSSLPLQP